MSKLGNFWLMVLEELYCEWKVCYEMNKINSKRMIKLLKESIVSLQLARAFLFVDWL